MTLKEMTLMGGYVESQNLRAQLSFAGYMKLSLQLCTLNECLSHICRLSCHCYLLPDIWVELESSMVVVVFQANDSCPG